jgi:hypothetical protein
LLVFAQDLTEYAIEWDTERGGIDFVSPARAIASGSASTLRGHHVRVR